MATIIAKNQTAGDLTLSQLSVPDRKIPASGQVNLSNYNTTSEIQDDYELTTYITNDQVLLNWDGYDLTKAQSLAAIKSHAASHTHGGRDEIATATPGANAIPKSTADSTIDYWVAGNYSSFALRGAISPSTISSDQNDYNPTGLASASLLRLSASAPGFNITGLSGGSSGRVIIIHNVGSYPVTLTAQGTSSAEANRFAIGSKLRVFSNECAFLQYDSTSSRWRLIGSSSEAFGDPQQTILPREHFCGDFLAYSANSGFVASNVEYVRIWLQAGMNIISASTFLRSGGSAVRYVRFGIYDQADPNEAVWTVANGKPRNKLAQTAQRDTNVSNAYITQNLESNYLVTVSGYYWMAIICSASQPVFSGTAMFPGAQIPMYFETSSGTTLPATTGTLRVDAQSGIVFVSAREF